MPTPAFRAAGTTVFGANSAANPTVLSPVKSGSTVNGDLLLLVTVCRATTPTCATPTGWTLLSGFPVSASASTGGKIYVFTRLADGTANDAPTVTWSGVATGTTGDSCDAVIVSYQNTSETRDAISGLTENAATTTSSTIPSTTTVTDKALVVGIAVKLQDGTVTSTVTTFTERVDASTTNASGQQLEVSDKVVTPAGASGTATVTWSSGTSARGISISVALKPGPLIVAVGQVTETPLAQPITGFTAAAPIPAGQAGAGAAATTLVLTSSVTIPAGAKIWLPVSWGSGGVALTISSVSGGGLTWRIDRQSGNGVTGGAMISADAPAGLAASTAITITFSGSAPDRQARLYYHTGYVVGNTAYGLAEASAATAAWSTGNVTATTSDLVIGMSHFSAGSGSPTSAPSSGTELHDDTLADGEAQTALYYISTGSAKAISGTWSAAPTRTYSLALAYPRSTGVTGTVNEVTETDLAQPMGKAKTKAVGEPTETDLSQPVTRVKTKAIGQAFETDTAQAITINPKRRLVKQVTETDVANAVTINPKRRLILETTETELSQPVTRHKTKLLGQASETGLAQPIAHSGVHVVGQVLETDTAQPVTINPKRRLVKQATETDAAQPVAHSRAKAVAQATELDTAQSVVVNPRRRLVKQALETETSQPVAHSKTRATGQPLETDLAQPIKRIKVRTIGQALETDLAQSVAHTGPKLIAVGQALESDSAMAVRRIKVRLIGQAAESDTATLTIRHKTRAIGQAAESDIASSLARLKSRPIAQASETDTATITRRVKLKPVGQAAELDVARPVTFPARRLVAQANSSETAQPVAAFKRITPGGITPDASPQINLGAVSPRISVRLF